MIYFLAGQSTEDIYTDFQREKNESISGIHFVLVEVMWMECMISMAYFFITKTAEKDTNIIINSLSVVTTSF